MTQLNEKQIQEIFKKFDLDTDEKRKKFQEFEQQKDPNGLIRHFIRLDNNSSSDLLEDVNAKLA